MTHLLGYKLGCPSRGHEVMLAIVYTDVFITQVKAHNLRILACCIGDRVTAENNIEGQLMTKVTI